MAEEDVAALKRDVQQILFYLKNDEAADRKGLIAQVAELKKEVGDFIQSYRMDKAIRKAQIGIIATIGGGCTLVIEWMINLFFK